MRRVLAESARLTNDACNMNKTISPIRKDIHHGFVSTALESSLRGLEKEKNNPTTADPAFRASVGFRIVTSTCQHSNICSTIAL